MADLIGQNDAQAQQQITFWDAGAPAYRWIDLINQRALDAKPLTPYAHRVYTYVAQAMYDATVAAWESKYFYNRPRPSELDHNLPTAAAVPPGSVPPAVFEPATRCLEGSRSIQLSYRGSFLAFYLGFRPPKGPSRVLAQRSFRRQHLKPKGP